MRVIAALSGGVDSAVATAMAVEAGHDVTGVHLWLTESVVGVARGCSNEGAAADAARTAHKLGIPFEIWDFSDRFEEKVVADFLAEYEAGYTPNPCVRCNEFVKFEELLRRGLERGFDAVVTGHYAKVIVEDGQVELHRAADEDKDQSYVLSAIDQADLAHVILPLGDAPTKDWVREEAEKRGLEVSNKPDSFDICFIPDGDTAGFLASHFGAKPGKIVDIDGTELGTHSGYYQYTVGQRKGLGIGRPSASGRPRYVLSTDPPSNTVVVGEAEHLQVDTITTRNLIWQAPPELLEVDAPVQSDFGPNMLGVRMGSVPADLVTVQIRAHGTPSVVETLQVAEGEFDPADGSYMVIRLAKPLRGVAPGQSLVVYRGTRVVAEGTIASAANTDPKSRGAFPQTLSA